jgi:hypothetical protein
MKLRWMMNYLSKKDWEESYKPILNPFDPTRNSVGPDASEVEFVMEKDEKYVWSLVWDFVEEINLLTPGKMPPDGGPDDIFFITEIPWSDSELVVAFED